MRSAAAATDDAHVSHSGVERVVVELSEGEPINGQVQRPPEPPRSFHGWLELTALLEGLRPKSATGEADAGDADN
jgi:hypothetical protein